MTKKIDAAKEFKVGKNKIGFISGTFADNFGKTKFEARKAPTVYQTLSVAMNDATIESTLKPGICELGDVLAFIKADPKDCKNGNWNLFYTASFVVRVCWHSDSGKWCVFAWQRGGSAWYSGYRVFSPATGSRSSAISAPVSMDLETAIKLVKKEGYKIFKEI